MSSIHAAECKFCSANNVGFGVRGDARVYLYCADCEAQGPVGDDYDEAKELWNLTNDGES